MNHITFILQFINKEDFLQGRMDVVPLRIHHTSLSFIFKNKQKNSTKLKFYSSNNNPLFD